MPKKRKAPPRAAKKDPYTLDELLTSDKSLLIDIDLHGKLASFFAKNENWVQVPDSDKDFIRTLLPPYVELNDDGSIPTSFWKYNPEFRLECRNLQEDLRSGRMDPEWQRQAAQAMNERAAGKFDDFKEREFEEYWGQKQKVDWNVLAGHASKVRLEELLKEGLFRTGDVWSFHHTFGKGEAIVRVEKECKVVKISGKSVTLAIPPGQLKFARRLQQSSPTETSQAMDTPDSQVVSASGVASDEVRKVDESRMTNGLPEAIGEPSSVLSQRQTMPAGGSAILDGETSLQGTTNQPCFVKEEDRTLSEATERDEEAPPSPTYNSEQQLGLILTTESSTLSSPAPSSKGAHSTTTFINDQFSHLSAATEYDVILYEVTGLYALEKKILEIDGRVKSGSRTASTWRDIRCRRDEQDMGSLFEIRDEYYAYKVAKGNYRRPEKGSR